MGFFLPAAGAAAGGTAAATTAATAAGTTAASGLTLSSALSYAATAATVLSTLNQAKSTTAAAKIQSRQEKMAATDREIQRRKRLVAALATQNARFAAGGVRSFEGSPARIAMEDIRQSDFEGMTSSAMTSQRLRALGVKSRSARIKGMVSAGGSLLDLAGREIERS